MIDRSLLQKPVDGWQERTEKLAKPGYFSVIVSIDEALLRCLTHDETERFYKKVRLVTQATQMMLAGMVKGTVKYATDEYTLNTWMAHLIDEGADQMNYQILLAYAYKRTYGG